jgi:ParB family chromosome partitioning protein
VTESFEFKDPKKRQPLTVKTVKKTDLEVIGHQRKPRASHLKQLTASIERIGFVTPLIVVERDGPDAPSGAPSKKFVIIDGQHRFTAGSELGVREFPVVVVPEKLARRMMSLNVEKDLNIRERCEISLSIYREVLEQKPNMKEDDEEISDTIDNAHYVTLGLAYEGPGRLAGGALEPILKKVDGFLNKTLSEAYEVRQGRAEKVLEAWKLVKAVEDALKSKNKWHSMVRYQIISAADPAKRARKPQDFEKAFPKFIAKLEELASAPEKVLRQKVDSDE